VSTTPDSVPSAPSAPVASGVATADQLLGKKARTGDIPVVLADGTQVVIKVKAIGQADYDAMLAAHPPTAAQKKDDGTFDIDTFGPALVSACAVDPKLSVAQATAIWTSPDWSRGELTHLFTGVIAVNNARLDVPFSATG